MILPGGYLFWLFCLIGLFWQLFHSHRTPFITKKYTWSQCVTLLHDWPSFSEVCDMLIFHITLCQTYKVIIDSTSFNWMGVCNASLHPLESVESVLIELYTVLVNFSVWHLGSDLNGPQGSLAYLSVLTSFADNFYTLCLRRTWKECQ